MARKKHEEEHENHERWLVSYADFITLLFAFFVVMYSVSRVDNKKLSQTAQSIKWALHFSGTGGVGALPLFEGPPSEGGCAANTGSSAWSQPQIQRAVETFRKRIESRLKPFLIERSSKNSVMVDVEGGRLTVRLAAARFFDPAQSALRPEALPVLDAVAGELVEMHHGIRVEAHTDDQPVQGRFRNNWELSAARAATVANYVEQEFAIPADRLSASGMGGGRPMASNETAAGRETNRRVELVVDLLPSDVMNLAVR